MKLKNRAYLFLVVRNLVSNGEGQLPIASFYTMEGAEEYAGVCQQEFLERNINEFSFEVVPVIYYDQ